MKDNFSRQADLYVKYRPEYPQELYDFIFSRCEELSSAWDCATGNGQVAKVLASNFKEVKATDISIKQLDNAYQASNIAYSIAKAENTEFEANTFDLVTVGQALHWFEFETFFEEVKRVLKPDGVLAIWGYHNMLVNKEVDELNLDFYNNITGPYWDEERKIIDDQYADIDFPFVDIESKSFVMTKSWNLAEVEGFFNTWSAVQHYIKKEERNPVPEFIERMSLIWRRNEVREIRFPIFLKLMKMK